jgi:hypothetical protein
MRIGRARTFFAIPLLRPACQQKATVSPPVRAKKSASRVARAPIDKKTAAASLPRRLDEDDVVAR